MCSGWSHGFSLSGPSSASAGTLPRVKDKKGGKRKRIRKAEWDKEAGKRRELGSFPDPSQRLSQCHDALFI